MSSNSSSKWKLNAKAKRISPLSVLFVLVMSSLVGAIANAPQIINPVSASSNGTWPTAINNLFTNKPMQFGVSFWAGDINTLTGGCTTVACYSGVIQKYFLPHDIYWIVGMYQYGDANTSSTCASSLCSQTQYVNLLTAADTYGLHVLVWFPTWAFDGGGEPTCTSGTGNAWQDEVLNYWAPTSQTSIAEVNSTGGAVCNLRFDYANIWNSQMERDIYELYSNYGSYPSFAGFLQYYEFSMFTAQAYGASGYSNQTIANFTANSNSYIPHSYVNVTSYEPYDTHDMFTSSAGDWETIYSTGTGGLTTLQSSTCSCGGSDGFYANQTVATTTASEVAWAPTGGINWQTTSLSNETLWIYPTSSSTTTSSVQLTFNFEDSATSATENYTYTVPTVSWNAWNKVSVDWWKSYLSSHSSESYNTLVSIDVAVNPGTTASTSQVIVASPYSFMVDWLGRTVDTFVKYNDIHNFELGACGTVTPDLYSGHSVYGTSLPSGTAAPFKEGCFTHYKSYMQYSYLVNAGNYCQSLDTNCLVMSDEGPVYSTFLSTGGTVESSSKYSTGFGNYQGYSLSGAGGGWNGIINGTNVEGAICGPSSAGQYPNCGIGTGSVTTYGIGDENMGSPYVAQESIGFRCYPASSWSCNNGAYNPNRALPFELSAGLPSQLSQLTLIQTSAETLASNYTGGSYIPTNTLTQSGQEYLYTQRPYAMAANSVQYQRPTGYVAPLASILYVDSGSYTTVENFLTPQQLTSLGFNVTVTNVQAVKDYTLSQFNVIIWTSTGQPNESNDTTYNDLVTAINSGVGFILVGNGGTEYNGGTGITSTQLVTLFGLHYPGVGCCNIASNPATVANFNYSLASSVATHVLSPYTTLTQSDMTPNASPAQMYLYATSANFNGTVLATANDTAYTGTAGVFPTMVEANGTGAAPGTGRMFWIGTTYDTSGLYGSYVGSTGLYTKQLDVYLNMILYAAQKNSDIPYIYASSGSPAFEPGVQMSLMGGTGGSRTIFLSDYNKVSGGSSTTATDYEFNGATAGIGTSWIAVNLQNFNVVSSSTTSSVVDLPVTLTNQTWAPIYVANTPTSNLENFYSNWPVTVTISGTTATYVTSGNTDGEGIQIEYVTTAPTSVSSNLTGTLTQQTSLTAWRQGIGAVFNQTQQYNWKPFSGWYYDSTNNLLYIAYETSDPVQLSVNGGAATSYTIILSTYPGGALVGTVTPSGTVSESGNFSITATPVTGYTFSDWTFTSGITVANSTAASTTAVPTADGNLTANYKPNGICGVQ